MPYDLFDKDKHESTALLEALLFLSGQPMSVADLCEHTGWTEVEVTAVAETLRQLLEDQRRGITVIRVAGGYQLVTKPPIYEAVNWVRRGNSELTPMALEVLSIVAFKQPVTRAEIEKIRGVSSERLIYTLMQQGLIVDLGRKDSPGRPILYGTSAYFLECMGMDSLTELSVKLPEQEVLPFDEETPAPETDVDMEIDNEADQEETTTEEIDGKTSESNQ